jgi:hypothetical protein
MTKNKRKRPQKPKGMGNEAWKRADLDQHNRNNTVPSGKVYKRKSKHREW